MTNERPALLGGAKEFPEGLQFSGPTIPPWEEVAGEFEAMYRTGFLTKGPYLRRFEARMEEYLGVKHVVAVSSCTSGLILGLQALNLDRERGEIIVPSFSFMATFHAIKWNGYKPVFVDCEPGTFTIDVEAVRRAITPNTVGVMAACVFGNPPDWPALEALCCECGLPLFSDSAHGLGSTFEGRRLGGRGCFEVFSLSPTKLLTTAEGGLLATNRDDVAEFVRSGRDYGNPGSYDCPHAGLNARMSEFHAILGLKGVEHLDKWAEHRRGVAAAYVAGLRDLPGLSFQKIREHAVSSYKDFAVLVDEAQFGLSRDVLGQALLAEGIPWRAYFSPCGHQLSAYGYLPSVSLPVCERVSSSVICPPIMSEMAIANVHRVCEAVKRIHASVAEIREAAAGGAEATAGVAAAGGAEA